MTTATGVRERPILFSAPMVRAILDGRKTQTRRAIVPQPRLSDATIAELTAGGEKLSDVMTEAWRSGFVDVRCPFGDVGTLLWVRETFCDGGTPKYRADYQDDQQEIIVGNNEHLPVWGVRWRPSIHMPKTAARIWLRVTDLRVERVQEIAEADAIAEGIERPEDLSPEEVDCWPGAEKALFDGMNQPATVFRRLWDFLNEKRGYGWDANPWVWVVSFERSEAPR